MIKTLRQITVKFGDQLRQKAYQIDGTLVLLLSDCTKKPPFGGLLNENYLFNYLPERLL